MNFAIPPPNQPPSLIAAMQSQENHQLHNHHHHKPNPGGVTIEDELKIGKRKMHEILADLENNMRETREMLQKIERDTDVQLILPQVGSRELKASDPTHHQIRLVGQSEGQLQNAKRDLLSAMAFQDRITLRMDVDYTTHSHLIGKNGNNIATMMRETSTHIHFPDCNKANQQNNHHHHHNNNYHNNNNQQQQQGTQSGISSQTANSNSDSGVPGTNNNMSNQQQQQSTEKSNHVTVSGSNLKAIEEARRRLRRAGPFQIKSATQFDAATLSLCISHFQTAATAAGIQFILDAHSYVAFKSTIDKAGVVVDIVRKFAEEWNISYLKYVETLLDIMPKELDKMNFMKPFFEKECRVVCVFPKFGQPRSSIKIIGPVQGVFRARQTIIEKLPVTLIWEMPVDHEPKEEFQKGLQDLTLSRTAARQGKGPAPDARDTDGNLMNLGDVTATVKDKTRVNQITKARETKKSLHIMSSESNVEALYTVFSQLSLEHTTPNPIRELPGETPLLTSEQLTMPNFAVGSDYMQSLHTLVTGQTFPQNPFAAQSTSHQIQAFQQAQQMIAAAAVNQQSFFQQQTPHAQSQNFYILPNTTNTAATDQYLQSLIASQQNLASLNNLNSLAALQAQQQAAQQQQQRMYAAASSTTLFEQQQNNQVTTNQLLQLMNQGNVLNNNDVANAAAQLQFAQQQQQQHQVQATIQKAAVLNHPAMSLNQMTPTTAPVIGDHIKQQPRISTATAQIQHHSQFGANEEAAMAAYLATNPFHGSTIANIDDLTSGAPISKKRASDHLVVASGGSVAPLLNTSDLFAPPPIQSHTGGDSNKRAPSQLTSNQQRLGQTVSKMEVSGANSLAASLKSDAVLQNATALSDSYSTFGGSWHGLTLPADTAASSVRVPISQNCGKFMSLSTATMPPQNAQSSFMNMSYQQVPRPILGAGHQPSLQNLFERENLADVYDVMANEDVKDYHVLLRFTTKEFTELLSTAPISQEAREGALKLFEHIKATSKQNVANQMAVGSELLDKRCADINNNPVVGL